MAFFESDTYTDLCAVIKSRIIEAHTELGNNIASNPMECLVRKGTVSDSGNGLICEIARQTSCLVVLDEIVATLKHGQSPNVTNKISVD